MDCGRLARWLVHDNLVHLRGPLPPLVHRQSEKIRPVGLTSGASTTDGTSFATASITPGANRLLLLWGVCTHGTVAETPNSVTGNGLTWTEVDSVPFTSAVRNAFCFQAIGAAPSAGAVTIGFSTTHTSVAWHVVEYDGVDTAAPVVQSTTNTAAAGSTTIVGTLAAMAHADNLHAYGCALTTNASVTPGGGFRERGDQGTTAAVTTVEVADKVFDTTADPTFASAGAVIISVEVKAA